MLEMQLFISQPCNCGLFTETSQSGKGMNLTKSGNISIYFECFPLVNDLPHCTKMDFFGNGLIAILMGSKNCFSMVIADFLPIWHCVHTSLYDSGEQTDQASAFIKPNTLANDQFIQELFPILWSQSDKWIPDVGIPAHQFGQTQIGLSSVIRQLPRSLLEVKALGLLGYFCLFVFPTALFFYKIKLSI